MRYFLERYTVCCGTVLIGKARDTKQFGLPTVLLNHIHYMERFYLKNIQKNIFRTPPPPKNSCYLRNERLAVADMFVGYFPPLKKILDPPLPFKSKLY